VVSAIDSISYGDLIDLMVRRGQNWNLLPTQVNMIDVSVMSLCCHVLHTVLKLD